MTTVSDDFTRADGDPGAAWSKDLDASWTIVSNQLTNAGAGDAEIRFLTSLASNDQYAEVQGAASLGFRAAGAFVRHPANTTRTYYLAQVYNEGSRELGKRVNGIYTAIAGNVSAAAAPPYVVRVEAEGSTIRGLVNGVVYSTATDTSIPSGPHAGIFGYALANTGRIDAFTAGDIGPVVLPDSWLTEDGHRLLTEAGHPIYL